MTFFIKVMLMAALVAVPGLAQAQSSVTLYGVIDTGVDWENQVATAPGQKVAAGSAFRMTSLASSGTTRFGIRGTEDLGAGYKTLFELQSTFAPNSGALLAGGRLFGQSAWVGVDGPFGTVKLGRQVNMTYIGLLNSTVIGPALYSIASLDYYLPNSRSDNAISYFGTLHRFVAGVTYSTGHDSAVVAGPPTSNSGAAYNPGATNCPGNLPGDPLDCRQITALLGYWAPHYGGQIVYDEIRGGVGVLPGSASFEPSGAKPFPSSSDKTTRYMVSGYSKFEKVTISGGLIHRRTTMPGAPNYQTNIFYLGTSYFFRPDIVFDGEISRITTTDQKNANFYVMRATYLLSKRTAVYTMLGFMQNNSAAAYSAGVGYATIPGAKQVGILVGMRTTF